VNSWQFVGDGWQYRNHRVFPEVSEQAGIS